MARKCKYYDFPDFLDVCRLMKLKGITDYRSRYKKATITLEKISELPSNSTNKKDFTKAFELLKKELFLPSNPNLLYGKLWLENGRCKCVTGNKFYSFKKFVEVCKKMKLRKFKDYRSRYKEDPRLPCHPNIIYSNDWRKAGKSKCILAKK